MLPPVLLIVDEHRNALEDLEAQLVQRYAGDYRIESLSDPEQAIQTLAKLAHAGEEVALVLAGKSLSDATGGELLGRARELHPHAKRALVVPPGAWADETTAEAIRDAMALGRIDYYVSRPAGSRDEVFHQTISSLLLEWATERRLVPHTVHIVGEAWGGRAHELREVFERCAVPHAFCLADSDEGRKLLAAPTRSTAQTPAACAPTGHGSRTMIRARLAAAGLRP
jgi:thioredoxin reductase (NADPH)